MASDEHLASAPAEGPPAPAPPSPESSAAPPPKASSSSPPPPTPSPPPAKSSPPPATPSPPPPAPSGRTRSPPSPSDQSTVKTPGESPASRPPETSPAASSPPPASPPPSPPPTSRSPPPSSPPPQSSPPPAATSTPPSRQSPSGSTTPPASPPASSSEKPIAADVTPSPPPRNAASASTPPARAAGAPPPPHETPTTPGTAPATAAKASPAAPVIPSSASQALPPPTAVTLIVPAPGPPGAARRSLPDPHGTAPPRPAPPAGSGGVKTEVLIGVSVVGFALTLASLFILLCCGNRDKKRRHALPSRRNVVVPQRVVSPDVYRPSNGPAPSPASGTTNSYDLSGSRSWFTYDELSGITGGFAPENVIGEGGFGKVYVGALANGRRVAVKQLKVGSGQGEREFRAEVDIISRIHHRHLVTLVGYCVTENHRLLVYEFVPNKTLEHHLHGKGVPVMDWSKRMKIAIGSARGLTYLHEDCHPRIIHRDIKTANILLDDAYEAKVADFGLAKLANDTATHISTRVMGTFGYMAPEYASSGKLTDRSDVFSFGVVLLELITGRKPVDSSQPLGEESLVEWARPLLVDALEKGDFSELADPALERRYSTTEMRRMVEAAAACVRHSAAKRPRMVQVWRSLDVDGTSSDLTNGVKLGQSTAYDSGEYSADIELFRRMAFANDLSTAELGFSGEDDQRHAGSKAAHK
ncbi:hypothetical protein ACP70R_037124 [Stipagrostis hirtigluma subsp. patula]